MAQIVLDSEAFKALSSDTRLQILKALDARPLTVSELGRLLALNKATVFEHLKQLGGADLIKRVDDEGRKWVYYKLSWKGRNVVHPENVQFMLMLGTAALSLGGLVAQLVRLLPGWLDSGSRPEISGGDGSGDADAPDRNAAPAAPAMESPAASESAPQGAPPPNADNATAPEIEPVTDPEPPPAPSGDVTEPPFWDDPNVWLLGLLAIILFLTALFVWRQFSERRRERILITQRLQGSEGSSG